MMYVQLNYTLILIFCRTMYNDNLHKTDWIVSSSSVCIDTSGSSVSGNGSVVLMAFVDSTLKYCYCCSQWELHVHCFRVITFEVPHVGLEFLKFEKRDW